jgi:hypothetical protein
MFQQVPGGGGNREERMLGAAPAAEDWAHPKYWSDYADPRRRCPHPRPCCTRYGRRSYRTEHLGTGRPGPSTKNRPGTNDGSLAADIAEVAGLAVCPRGPRRHRTANPKPPATNTVTVKLAVSRFTAGDLPPSAVSRTGIISLVAALLSPDLADRGPV